MAGDEVEHFLVDPMDRPAADAEGLLEALTLTRRTFGIPFPQSRPR